MYNYLSNPCTWFSSPSREKSFTYEGGSKLFHFCPSSCINHERLNGYIPVNVVFFANDEAHAANVIERMLNFRLAICKKYPDKYCHNPEIAQIILDHKAQWKFNVAPTNQLYQVGWASNDTIL